MLSLLCVRHQKNKKDITGAAKVLRNLSLKALDIDGDGVVSLWELIIAFRYAVAVAARNSCCCCCCCC